VELIKSEFHAKTQRSPGSFCILPFAALCETKRGRRFLWWSLISFLPPINKVKTISHAKTLRLNTKGAIKNRALRLSVKINHATAQRRNVRRGVASLRDLNFFIIPTLHLLHERMTGYFFKC